MRHIHWQTRLSRVIEAARRKGHVWGSHDCASFALRRCYWAITGTLPPLNYFHKTYSTESDSAEVLAQMGCTDVEDLAETFLERHAAPGLIQRGDVGVIDTPLGKALVVWTGNEGYAPGPSTLVHVKRDRIIAAFKVD